MPWSSTPVNSPVNTPALSPWSSSPSGNAVVRGGAWLSRLEKVAPLEGSGALSSTLEPRYGISGHLTGSGLYVPGASSVQHRSALFLSEGLPVGLAFETKPRVVQLSGNGVLENTVNDGLSAISFGAHPARLASEGSLTCEMNGGHPPVDGLYADVNPLMAMTGVFSSEGELAFGIWQIMQVAITLDGAGQLAGFVGSFGMIMADLTGAGQISAQVYELYSRLVSLVGSGALSASAFETYARGLGLTGGAQLAAILYEVYNSTHSKGGVGTVTALIMQKYSLLPPLGGGGALTATMAFPSMSPDITPVDNTGSFTILYWCNRIDLVALGGGEAGTDGTFVTNPGGAAGSYSSVTLVRGTDIPWSTAALSITVGAGGASSGADGGSSSVSATGMTTLTAAGGSGNNGIGGSGASPGDHTFNGQTYTGGASQPTRGQPGNAPGGGGGGGNVFGAGGLGAKGRVWVRSYQV